MCSRLFCYPHHSANPCEIPGVPPTACNITTLGWGGEVGRVRVAGTHFCLCCMGNPKRDFVLRPGELEALRQRCEKEWVRFEVVT